MELPTIRNLRDFVLVIVSFLTLNFHSVGAQSAPHLITGGASQVALLNAQEVAVDYGRSAFLDPAKHLRIFFNPDAKCVVSVVKGNPSSSQSGRLLPESFPCDFKNSQVRYQHYGGLNSLEDAIALLIRVDSREETQCLPVTLRVRVLFSRPLETLKKIETLIVHELGGLSEPINLNIMRPKFDEKKQTCQARIIQDENGPPFYGSIVNTSDVRYGSESGIVKTRYVECNEFLQGDLRYAHRRSERSPDKDYIPLVVEVCDKHTMAVEKREYIRMPVRIRRAPRNTPPIVDYSRASYSLQVDQTVVTALTPSVFRVDDRETEAGSIIINVTQALNPEDGYLVHTDDSSRPASTFFQRDIDALKVAYKPPAKLSRNQRLHQIWLEGIDSEGAKTAPFYFFIIIKPMNSFGPQVTKNLGLVMYEGQSRPLTPDALEIRDPDNEETVVVTVASGPRHGILEKNGQPVTRFTLADIESRNLRYIHDDSNSNDDNLLLRVSDGDQEIELLLVINILPKDDSPPKLLYNTGIALREGAMIKISQFDLSAADVDSDDTEVEFTIVDGPSAGFIMLRQPYQSSNDKQWKRVGDFQEKPVQKFQQSDIILGHVYYRHSGDEIFTDMFTFRLSDNADVPNTSGLKTFLIDITPVDDLPPQAHPNATMEMKVIEGSVAPFSKLALMYFDNDSDSNSLLYSILRRPYFAVGSGVEDISSAGDIVSASNLSKSLHSFTQKQVNHFKVQFRAPDQELGLNQRKVLFDFSVSDAAGNTLKDQRFTIHLQPVNNSPPRALTDFFKVAEGRSGVISSRNLRAQDADNLEADMMFSVKKPPLHGRLLLSGTRMHAGDRLYLEDLRRGRVVYSHEGSETKNDLVEFLLSDGLHSVPVKFPITIQSIDDKAPQLKSSKKQMRIQVQERGFVRLGASLVNLSDVDSDENEVVFLITVKPKLGLIECSGKEVSSFKFRDVKEGSVVYKHTSGEIGMQSKWDLINITLSDMSSDSTPGGNQYSGVTLEVEVLPVDSEPPMITGSLALSVNESDRVNIGVDAVSVSDVDTKSQNVRCQITNPPSFGFVETIAPLKGSEKSQSGKPIAMFSVEELQQRHVFYVQSKHKGVEPEQDSFRLLCIDGANTSPGVAVRIQISPVNDEIPVVYIHPSIVCVEDDYLAFSSTQINPFDSDRPEDALVINVARLPKHGRLLLQEHSKLLPATSFGKGALDGTEDKTFMYQHDGSETTSDNFDIRVSDGKHSVLEQVNITVISMDDETPRITVNTGLRMERGDTQVITSRNLKAADLDSESQRLTFVVMTTPQLGKLQKMSASLVEDLEQGGNFTQADIDARSIRYTHLDLQPGNQEIIRLDVSDGFNRLINQIFNIIISPVDDTLPDVLNTGVTLPENGKVLLTTDVLSASDLNSPDEKLRFTVTKVPLKGHLENVEYPGIPITTFSQLDLASSKIVYLHNSEDEVKYDNFEFEVTDGRNKVFRTFKIKLNSVNNKIPSLYTSTIAASIGLPVIITPFEIQATDNDTEPNMLRFTVHRLPKHGSILKDGIAIVSTFSQSDLDDNRISYKHDGSRSPEDHFTITVSDGLHREFFSSPDRAKLRQTPVRVDINIAHVDKYAPFMRRNIAANSLTQQNSMAVLILSPSFLRADDLDSPPEEVVFVVSHPPAHGNLVANLESTAFLERFSQADIARGSVMYVLKDSSNSTSDFFTFDVVDKAMNWLRGQRFHISWSVIEILASGGEVLENAGSFDFGLQRRGNLGMSSFVSVEVINGSAKENVDVHFQYGRTVHFSAGEKRASLKLGIHNNNKYEKTKSLQLILKNGINSLIGPQDSFILTLIDPEDEPSVSFMRKNYRVHESVGELRLPLQRLGDQEALTKIYCLTSSGTAKGTTGTNVTSNRDFLSLLQDDIKSIVTFDSNDTAKNCSIRIIDDSLYEEEETFQVLLMPYFGGKIGEIQVADVTIEEDQADEPRISFDSTIYEVDESDGTVQVRVTRHGTDLSMKSYVLFATKQQEPVSAKAESDYYPVVRTLEFDVDSQEVIVSVTVVDDTGRPRIEGKENFTVLVRAPRNARLGRISESTVVIDDTESDQPVAYFVNPEYNVREDSGHLLVRVQRTGDLRHESLVRCYTRQMTAKVDEDYVERPDTSASFVKFSANDFEKECRVEIINDTLYEPREEFRLFLGSHYSASIGDARIGRFNYTNIIIEDNDRPAIGFAESRYYIREPSEEEAHGRVEIAVVRSGDASQLSVVMVNTRDGSAKSGRHYEPVAKLLEFAPGIARLSISVKIYHVPENSLRTAFTIHLHEDARQIATLGEAKAVVFIEELGHRTGVAFPLNPLVISLMDYDNAEMAIRRQPVNGYPLICITACNIKHPRYLETQDMCRQESIDQSRTKYRWQVSAPNDADAISSEFKDVTLRVFFTSTDWITLDSIYFGAGSRVRCVAQPYSHYGIPGIESYSDDVIIHPSEGLCMPRRASDIGAETFSAQVSYTGSQDKDYPNLIKVKILIPHFDGLLPIISTKALSNFELTLSPDASRAGQHLCSNLLNADELKTRHGFIASSALNSTELVPSQPYEFDGNLRGNGTVRFYQNLNLDACLWTFEAYYDMSELVQKCGGQIVTDGKVENAIQSHLSVKVPLYISYLYHSASDHDGWMDFNHHSFFRLTAVYDTGVLWRDGVGLSEKARLRGNLHLTSIIIRKRDMRLQVNFRTKALFRGQFVLQTRDGALKSEVTTPDHPRLKMTLSLIRSDPSFVEPEQLWQFTSDYATRDYSGRYIFKLVPCTVEDNVQYKLPLDCAPQEPVSFVQNVTFQQTSEPVEARFRLNTRFYLLSSRERWLSESLTSSQITDVVFDKGAKIYGRVMVDTAFGMGSAYSVAIEKVFLCSGQDGYIPTFEPKKENFGCIADSPKLLYRFKIVDRLDPDSVEKEFKNVPFNAVLASDDPSAAALVDVASADGFSMDSSPLFAVSGGRSWFLHVIYTVRSQVGKSRGIGKRSIEYLTYATGTAENHFESLARRSRRDNDNEGPLSREIRSIGTNTGTNLQFIPLAYLEDVEEFDDPKYSSSDRLRPDDASKTTRTVSNNTLIAVIVILLIVIFVGLIGAFVYRKRQGPGQPAAGVAAVSLSGEVVGTEI